MPTLTFTHRFHNTSARVRIPASKYLSPDRQAKLEKTLCGIRDCRCNMYPLQSDEGSATIYQSGYILTRESK